MGTSEVHDRAGNPASVTHRLSIDKGAPAITSTQEPAANAAGWNNADVTVTFFMPAMPTMNMPAMRHQTKLPAVGGGVYRGTGQVMTAGRWDVTVDVSRAGQRLGSRQFAMMAK